MKSLHGSQDVLCDFAATSVSLWNVAAILREQQALRDVKQALEERARISVIQVEIIGIINYL